MEPDSDGLAAESVARTLPDPDDFCLQALLWARPNTPFHTRGFLDAERAIGEDPVAFLAISNGMVVDGCVGFIQTGIRSKRIKIPSIPALPADHDIWTKIWQFCLDVGVSSLSLETYASSASQLPKFPRETERRQRGEYILSLRKWDPTVHLSINHRRNIARARMAGAKIVETTDLGEVAVHEQLIGLSYARRRARGEAIFMTGSTYSRTLVETILTKKTGSLFQVRIGAEVVSSALILQSPTSGYYFSAGTSPHGMCNGASQFLIFSIAERLRVTGKTSFNFGGAAADQPGLARFKRGFGAKLMASQTAAFAPAKGLWSHLMGAVRLRAMRRAGTVVNE